jgi:hypothetical protein
VCIFRIFILSCRFLSVHVSFSTKSTDLKFHKFFSLFIKLGKGLFRSLEVWNSKSMNATGLLDADEVPFARMDSMVGIISTKIRQPWSVGICEPSSQVVVEKDFRPLECSEGYIWGLDASHWRFGGASEGRNARRRVAVACDDCGNIFKLRSLYNNGTSDCSIEHQQSLIFAVFAVLAVFPRPFT